MFQSSHPEQFVYPVGDFDDGNQLIVLYQKSLEEIELWIVDSSNQQAAKGLSSFLTPANLRMMPSGKGFSFIDKGYIKIKEFAKRSPKTLSIYEPIGLFSSMNWIDEELFYFVAREGDFFQIFQGDLEANVQRLTHEPADALYPQKIGATLFYMKRDMNNKISIISKPWNPKSMIESHDEPCELIQESYQQLCFLRMISTKEGFYLQAPTRKTKNDCYEFSCHHIKQNNENEWKTQNLFSFKIPSKYLSGSSRLYESLEPFLPNYTSKDHVYFVNWEDELDQFELYNLNIEENNIQKASDSFLCRSKKQNIFSPYISESKIYCGFILKNERLFGQNIFETINDDHLELPYFEGKK